MLLAPPSDVGRKQMRKAGLVSCGLELSSGALDSGRPRFVLQIIELATVRSPRLSLSLSRGRDEFGVENN